MAKTAKGWIKKVWAAAMLAVALASCAAQAPYVTLMGKLAGSNGTPLPNATINFIPTQQFFIPGINSTLQVGNIYGNGVPSGVCLVSGQFYTNISTVPNTTWQCIYGVWTAITNFSGYFVQLNPTADQTISGAYALNVPGKINVGTLVDTSLPVTTSAICPDGTGGAFTTTGCVSQADLAMQVVPPIIGQVVVIYPTVNTPGPGGALFWHDYGLCPSGGGEPGGGGASTTNTSGSAYACPSTFAEFFTMTWSGFSLPSYVLPANVTAIYATATSSFAGGGEYVDMYAIIPTVGNVNLKPTNTNNNYAMQQVTALYTIDPTLISGASFTAEIYGQTGNHGKMNIANVALIVYYTGTPPPATTAIQVVPPAFYNPSINTLGVDPNAPFPGLDLQPATVATLPDAATPPVGTIYSVMDGTSATDCTTGGSTHTVLCQTNGTAWSAFSAGSSGITALTGDVTGSGSGSVAATVKGLNAVPFCTGFAPTNGQNVQYTTASTPNPCYAAATAAATAAAVTHQYLTGYSAITGAFTQAQPTLADILGGIAPGATYDFSNASVFLPQVGGGNTMYAGQILYDSTYNNWHIWASGADKLLPVFSAAAPPTPGHLAEFQKTANAWSLVDGGAPSGGGSVSYNPANTLYVFTGDSILADDTQVLAPQIAVTGGSCNGTVCTITNSGTNGLAVSDWVFVGANVTGFPSPPSPFSNATTGYGFFQVLSTGLSSTQFEFNYTYATATITGGTVQRANYFLAQQTMQQPFFNGHGAFKIILDSNNYLAGIDSDYTALFHSISPVMTGNTPEYLIINDIFNNDLHDCATAATIEGHLQSIWAKAHTDGWVVVQGTSTFAPWNNMSCPSVFINAARINNWLYSQGKTSFNTTGLYAGEYWDNLADVGSVLSNFMDTNLIASNGGIAPGGVQPYAQTLNEAMALQSSATKAKSYIYYGSSLLDSGSLQAKGEIHTPLVDSYDAFSITDAAQDADDFEVNTIQHQVSVNNFYRQTSTGNNPNQYGLTDVDYMSNLTYATGRAQCHSFGQGNNPPYNQAYFCFNYQGNNSLTNSLVMGLKANVVDEYLGTVNSTDFQYFGDGSFLPPGGVLGPAAAPTGSCSRLGAYVSSQDGKITYCPASATWTTYTGAGSVPTTYSGSGAPPPFHRYWRMVLVSSAGGTYWSMSALQFRAVAGVIQAPAGGTWYSPNTGYGTDINQLSQVGSFPNRWASNAGGSSGYVEYDFGSSVPVAEVAIVPDSYSGENPTAFNIQYSDNNSTWTTLSAVTGASGTPGVYELFEMPGAIAASSSYKWYADTSVTPMALYLQPTAGGAFFPVGGSLGGGYSAAGTPLPTCASGINGDTAVVSDAAAPLYMTAYTSGGTVTAAVICSYSGSAYAWLTH